ncbi:MAG TPA: site-specific integrase, partial [Actinomycetes bacterium]|nr:site-specific integrase [Actinomycetes bacterium]
MASAGIRKTSTGRYKVWWRLDDGTQGAKTFDARGPARDFKNELLAQVAADSWTDPRRGRILFDEWANHWWQLWASSPRRSPKGMETTESHLRCHLRPYFGRRQLRQITPSIVLRWQNDLEGKLSHSGVMACRSILLRILEAARRERLLPTNPVRDVEAPRPRINPDRIFGHERRRTFTPEEFGRFLAVCRPFYCDHFLAQIGTGLRSGELLGLRRRRVFPELRRIEVIEVRYEAGRFGRGFKAEPKSPASVRAVPMADQVREAIVRQLSTFDRPDDLVFTGPGGSNGVRRGARPPLSTGNLRRVYKAAVATAGLTELDLRGPHDLRHTFATWLEDAGIPSRVIDELMGHAGGRRDRGAGGSPMGRVYRETTPAMLARVTAALDDRIGHALAVAAYLLR